MEIWATMRQDPDGSWRAATEEEPPRVAIGATRRACLERLRRLALAGRPAKPPSLTLVVEVLPTLAGVAEAAEVMGWDKRRVITYIRRGRFPRPLQSLASGRVWVRAEVEDFAGRWRERQRRRPDLRRHAREP